MCWWSSRRWRVEGGDGELKEEVVGKLVVVAVVVMNLEMRGEIGRDMERW